MFCESEHGNVRVFAQIYGKRSLSRRSLQVRFHLATLRPILWDDLHGAQYLEVTALSRPSRQVSMKAVIKDRLWTDADPCGARKVSRINDNSIRTLIQRSQFTQDLSQLPS